MDLLQALALGIVQGLTEFIPVSSSGHLVVLPWLLGWPEPSVAFDATLHLGTLLALLVYLWSDIWSILGAWLAGWRHRNWSAPAGRLGWLIILATIPAVVAGVVLEEQFTVLFGSPGFVGAALVLTGCILVLSERFGSRLWGLEKLGAGSAVVIGVAQAVAITPGISRSGATIATGLAFGLSRTAAARFSFLLGMPIIAGAGLSQLVSLLRHGGGAGVGAATLAVGFLAAAVSGYLCISFLLAYLRRGSLYIFAAYCGLAGVLTVVLWFVTGGKGLG